MSIPSRNLTLCLVAAVLLGACGSGANPNAAAERAAAAARNAARKAANPADQISRNMVGAVALNKAANVPVQVKFELRDRPHVAQPVDVDLVIVPMSGSVDRVSGKLVAEEGLDVVEGGQIPAIDHPVEGVPIRHTIKLMAQEQGIFTFSAVVTVDSGGQSSTQTFAMPVIAGEGMPDLPAKPAPGSPATAAAPGRPALAATSASTSSAASQ